MKIEEKKFLFVFLIFFKYNDNENRNYLISMFFFNKKLYNWKYIIIRSGLNLFLNVLICKVMLYVDVCIIFKKRR